MAKAVDHDSWTGGLLITDERGLPLDFRYVEPVKPGKLQKIIYGDALQRYLVLDTIGSSLIRAANLQVDWVFTSDPVMLELQNEIKGRCIAISNGETRSIGDPGTWQVRGNGDLIFQASKRGPAIRLSFTVENESGTEEIANDLSWLAERFDFTEPLIRLESALKEICLGNIN